MIEKFGYVLIPVDSLDAALAFYEQVLGTKARFRDGDRFAAVPCGDVTLALLGPSERATADGVAPSIKVRDLDALAEQLRAGGLADPTIRDGGPERLLEIRDPSGNPLVFYQPKPPAQP
jgi:catechol 2,3-dioxygenase-like lactoylglutathione lyase family enzyme